MIETKVALLTSKYILYPTVQSLLPVTFTFYKKLAMRYLNAA